ncbi:MAG: glycosyl hydrolase [Verrucomicrobiota bacterium]|jgi:hypothetical protein
MRPIKTLAQILVPLLLAGGASAQDHPWQKISDPTTAQLAANFDTPPPEYSSQFDCGYSDTRTREAIGATLDRAKSVHVQAAFIEPGRGRAPYLSPGYFDAVKVLVEEAKKRNMKLWFDDDGGYPSGFAGGKFTVERPELCMMALVAPQRVPVTAGQQYSYKLDAQTICVLAVNHDTGATQVLDSSSGGVNWTVPAGNWEIVLPRSQFRSGPTRSANNTTGAKDREHSLMDFLNPQADKLFAQWTFDAYKQAIGDELGKTVLGFRGDEPSFGFNPWSPGIIAEFQKRKGYDLRPHLATIAAINIGGGGRGAGANSGVNLDEGHRVFADYCDVWSDLFGENFFGMEGKWCADNHVEMQMHIEHEEILPGLASADGDFFKCMRSLQVPGIDTIWHQIWHDVVADFPKLASSATHLNGNPRAMCEAFAAYNPAPDLKEAGWIINHLMACGISRIEYMGMGGGGSNGMRGFYGDPGFPALSAYVNRASYLLGEGRPAAQIGVYIPSSSFWFNDTAANTAFLGIVHQLLQHQRDLDFVDEYALAHTLKLRGNELVNLSGQSYRGIVIPPVDAISKAALDNLRAFARAGGKVVFLGNAPKLVMDKNFLTATGPADISWAVLEPGREVTPKVLAALPASDVATDQPTTWLKYNHRRMKDAEMYFFFNEGEQALSLKATVANTGTARQAQEWDAASGKIGPWAGAMFENGRTILPLELPPFGTKIVMIGAQ